MRIKTRMLSLFMAIVMFLTSVGVIGFMIPTIIASGAESIDFGNALHFYIRHWHSFIDDEALYQGDSNDGEKDKYFVLVEGYIKPVKDENGNTSYEFYMVNQDSNAGIGDNPKYFKYGDGNGENELDFTLSPYIENLNEATGTITLSKRPLMDGSDALEKYAGLAISTGRRAIKETEDGTIEITYDPYIHLVKGHAFYTPWQMIVEGASATTVDGDNVKLEHMFSDEIDTASVYTYINDTEDGRHKAGEIVMSASNEDQVCVDKDDLPEGVNEEDVQLSKFYSTLDGLHTDNTITALDDGRTFISNLEAWYVEGHAPEVGMVLDASGSMVVPVDDPTPIQLSDEEIKKLGITQLGDSNPGSNGWNSYFINDETLAKIMNPRNSDNSMVGVSGYNYFVSGNDGYAPLGYWEGADALQPVAQLTFTNSDTLPTIPDKQNPLVYRSWLYDSITNEHARRVNPQVSLSELNGSYEFTDVDVEDWRYGDLKFSSGNGFQVAHSSNQAGILLDKKPSGGNFTLTFELIINATGSGQIEALYVGPMNSDESDSGYFRLYYNTTTKKLLGSQTNGDDGTLATNSTIANAAATKKNVALVFENADTDNGTVTIYIAGEKSGTGELKTPITDVNVIIAGVAGNYSGGNGDDLDIDTFTLYDIAMSSDLVKGIGGSGAPTIATRGDGRTLASINRKSIPSSGDWPTSAELFHTQAGWYFVTHAGQYDTHYNAIGTGKRMYGVSGKSNNGVTFTDKLTYQNTKISSDTEYSYKSTQDEPTKFYVDKDGYLRCFYQSSASNANSAACSYVYELTDAQYVRTEVLRRAIGMFVTDLSAESPAAKVSAVRFSTSYIRYGYYYYNSSKPNDSNNYKLVFYDEEQGKWFLEDGTAVDEKYVTEFIDDLPKLLMQDWTNDTIESSAFLSMNYGDDTPEYEKGGARAYTYSTAHHLPQYNYGLTGSTATWSGIQSYINTLDEYTEKEAPKYLIIFTDGADTYIKGNSTPVYIQLGKDAEPQRIEVGKAAATLADYLKGEGYTIFTVLLDGDNMRGTEDFDDAKGFLTGLSGPGRIEGETDAAYNERKAKGTYFFSLNENVDERKDMLAQENYGTTYSKLDEEQKAVVDAQFKANYTATDILTEIFTDEVLGEMVSALEGYTVKNYIDPRFDLQDSNGTVWHLNAGGEIVIGDGSGANGKITVSSTSRNKFKLTGDMTANAKEPYLRYDADEDMYYLEWVKQTIPTSSVGADRLAIWNAQYTLKAKDDFIGGNAILTNGNKASMNWVYHPGDLPIEEATDVADSPSVAESQPFGYDANSGTSDSKKTYAENGEVTDGYPSKGFPRTTVNVQLLPVNTNDLDGVVYMGEAISPRQLLTDIKDDYITDSYYLEYLKRYAYQRYDKQSDPTKKAEMDMPLLELLTDWLEIGNESALQKEFSLPYSYLPKVEYDDDLGKILLNEKGEAAKVYNNTGGALHEQDVVGILTYRWEMLDPVPDKASRPIEDYVKDDTEQVKYSLTVEFTPLQVGDTLEILNAAVETTDETTLEGIPIVAAIAVEGGEDIPARARDGIFADYIPLTGSKREFDSSYVFDRKNLNNDQLITEDSYKWNKEYKPEVYEEQIDDDIKPGDENYPYGSATFLNSDRTLTAFAEYTLDVVSGDIILELKMLIGELEEAAKKGDYVVGEDGKNHFTTTFTLEATRSFTDTDFIEKLKAIEIKNGNAWEDYAKNFEFTFALDYTEDEINELKTSLDEPGADPDGYVRVYAKVQAIKVKYGYGDSLVEKDLAGIAELPIGTYKFSSNGATLKDEKNILHFAGLEHEANKDRFKDAYPYFSTVVLNGINTTNEIPDSVWRKVKVNGEEVTLSESEITEDNVKTFVAEAASDKNGATFYIGTSQKTSPKRGNTLVDEKYYTDYRLGMLLLSTGMTRLTICEEGGKENESFVYRVKGTTLGGVPVELTVSVQGGGSTTVELPPGDYTVEEISDWSWRYENEKTEGEEDENWEISEDWITASTTLRFISYDPNDSDDPVEEHKTVTYYHVRNEKVWLGGENHKNNHFTFSNTATE